MLSKLGKPTSFIGEIRPEDISVDCFVAKSEVFLNLGSPTVRHSGQISVPFHIVRLTKQSFDRHYQGSSTKRGRSGDSLREDFLDDVAVDVRQTEVAAGVPVGELRVVEAEQVQDRGVEVVDVDRVSATNRAFACQRD